MVYLYKVQYNPKTNKFKVIANLLGWDKPTLTEAETRDGIMILSNEELSKIDKSNLIIPKDVTIF